jgi:hypothetical protein
MELNTVKLNDFVRLAGIIFEKEKASLMESAKTSGLFYVESIPEGSGESREYTEIDLQEYAKKKDEGEQAKRAKVQQGYSKIMKPDRFGLDIGITYEMRSRNKYRDVVRRLTNLAKLPTNRMDLDLTHRLTFGTATSYTDMDGNTVDVSLGDDLALFSTAHLLKGTSDTYRNRLAGNPQISEGSLEGMERLVVEETLNQFGEKVTIDFDILWTSDDPNTVNMAKKLIQSTADISAANNGVQNVYRGKYRHVILPRLATDKNGAVDSSKRRYWGIASSMATTAHVGIWEAPHLKVPANLNAGEDFATDDWNFGVRAGYGICIVNGSWIKFSSGDGA